MRAGIAVVVIPLLLSAVGVTASQDEALVGWEALEVPGWSVMVKRDVFTDAWESGAAFYDDDGIAALCDPARESYPSGLRVYVTGLPEGLPVGVAEIQYRLGDDPAATGAWEVDGSTLVVPDDLVEAVLNAGRIAVRVHDHTLVHQWANGSVIYLLMSECAGW